MTPIKWNQPDTIDPKVIAADAYTRTRGTGSKFWAELHPDERNHLAAMVEYALRNKPEPAPSPELDTKVRAWFEEVARRREHHKMHPELAHDFEAILAELEPKPDPLLIEAREIVAQRDEWFGQRTLIREGTYDDCCPVPIALAALKRGIELGEAK